MFNHDLAIVDVETTGMSPLHDRVIEVAIIRISKNKIVDKFTTLINPQARLSPYISMFTGITNEQLVKAPLFEEVRERISGLLEGAVFVAHNARFDYSFIRSELRRSGLGFKAKTFCTVRLSRRLFPEFRSHSLESVIARYKFKFKNRHRAYDDAHVLWQFLNKIKKTVPKNTLMKAWDDLTRSLYSAEAGLRNQIDSLPESPGVYIFYDKNDAPIYIGKSKNISDRVISHFYEDIKSVKHLSLTKEVVRVGHIKTTGELGALLLEAQLVKELKPTYNSRLKKTKSFLVLMREKNKEGYMTLKTQTASSLTEIDTDNLLGTFKSKAGAKEFLSSFAEKYFLCQKVLGIDSGRGSCFAYKIGKCRGTCIGKEKKQIYNSRFLIAFVESRQFRPWPYEGPVEIVEKNEEEDKWESYVIDRWCLIAKKNSLGDEEKFEHIFDPDYYRIISRHVRSSNPHLHKT